MELIINRFKFLSKGKKFIIAPIPYFDSLYYNEKPYYLEILNNLNIKELDILDLSKCLKNTVNIYDLFLPLCGHFSKKGHELVANEMIKLLEDRYKFKKRIKTKTKE